MTMPAIPSDEATWLAVSIEDAIAMRQLEAITLAGGNAPDTSLEGKRGCSISSS